MIANFLTLAFRKFKKNLVFSFINIFGLSLGIAAFIFILQYITYEKSVNAFHTNLPTIYRVIMQHDDEVSELSSAGLAVLGKQTLGEVKSYCRLAEGSHLGPGIVAIHTSEEKQNSFRENIFTYADGNFFTLFSFPIVKGDASLLMQPNTVALSETYAAKYFGHEDAMGKVITLNNQFGETNYTISIVYQDMPDNSDLNYPIIFSLQTLANYNGNESFRLDGVRSPWLMSFVQLTDQAVSRDVQQKLTQELEKKSEIPGRQVILQPMSQLHLASSLNDNLPTTGSLGFVYLLSGIAGLIVLIAWFNYVNLSTASALKRAKEVGIRKVSGANRIQLIIHFLAESLLLNLISFVLALGLIIVTQGLFNNLIGRHLSFSVFNQNMIWIAGAGVLIVGTLASGAYTAFVLSGYKPAHIIKGNFVNSSSGINLRKVLVITQFGISVFLIGSTVVLHRQLNYLQNKKLGMELDQLLVIEAPSLGKDETFRDRNDAFDHELSQLSFINKQTRTISVPLQGFIFSIQGITRPATTPGDENLSYSFLVVDDRYFDTYGMTIAAGEKFTPELAATTLAELDRLVINEAASKQLGFESSQASVGEKIRWQDKEYMVMGVLSDYHHMSLRKAIEPMIFIPGKGNMYTVKLSTQDLTTKIKTMEKLFAKYFPGNPFSYYFIGDTFQNQYNSEVRYSNLFTVASALAIVIACMGLFGLVTFMVEQRTKEIGVRKVLGASIPQIATLLTKDFLRLVLIGLFISTPLAWWAMSVWLQQFAYKMELNIWIFASAGGLAIIIALVTVSARTIKAAMSNSADSLRSE